MTGGPTGRGFAEALAHFHGQSHDKDVSQVATLFFGAEPSNGLARSVPGQVRPALPALSALRDLDMAAAPLDGPWSPAQRLLSACVEAVRVRRLSAGDRYPVHRAYPSPRGLFGADLFLLPRTGTAWCVRVDPQSHALQPMNASRVPDDPEELADARPVVAVDHRRYPPEYGRLRPSLALLEGGHLLAALGATLTRAGLTPHTHVDPAHEVGRRARAVLPPEMEPIAALTLDGPGPAGGVVLPAAATSRAVASAGRPGRTLRRWLDDRTSGLSTANLVTSAHIAPDRGAGVTSALVTALHEVGSVLPAPDALRLYRHVLADDRVDGRTMRELLPDGTEGPDRPVPRSGATNFSSTLGYTLTVDFPAWARVHGPHAEPILHTLLGWIGQWGCLGAASTDLCARPMRNFAEEEWASVLGLDPDQTPVYQLWVRSERGTYMDIPVDAGDGTPSEAS
ncbi:hypothetical protein [Nocardiopsis sp. MG754419]|uniref:hypothetical protein n=1 Tax=Nocardiopsis sp. MG754419 TaxID=2259865 RepID=UPI0027DC15EC|nr:hypothetical protein [Nocardiopsis sp. MG754419]